MVSQTPVQCAPFYPGYYQKVIVKGPFCGRRIVLLGLSFDAHFRALAALTNLVFAKVQGWVAHQSATEVKELRQSCLAYWRWSVLFWAGCFRPAVVQSALEEAVDMLSTSSDTERRERSAQTDVRSEQERSTPDSDLNSLPWTADSREGSPPPKSGIPPLHLKEVRRANGQTVTPTPSTSGESTKVSNWERKESMQLAGYQVVPFIVKNRVSRNHEEGYGQECTYREKKIPFVALISGRKGSHILSNYCSNSALGQVFNAAIEEASDDDFETILNNAFQELKVNLCKTYDKAISKETGKPILKQMVIIFVLVIAQGKLWRLDAILEDLTDKEHAKENKAKITSIPIKGHQSILMTSEYFNQEVGPSFSTLSVDQTQCCLYITPSRPSEPDYDQIPDLEEILEQAGEPVHGRKILVVSRTTDLERLLTEASPPSISRSPQFAPDPFDNSRDTLFSDRSFINVPPPAVLGTLSREASPEAPVKGRQEIPDMPSRHLDLKPT